MEHSGQFSRQMSDSAERMQQMSEARRLAAAEGEPRRTLTAARSERRTPDPTKPRRQLTGHEAFLKALEMSGADVVLEKVSSGQVYYGKLKHSDKWSVTMHVTATFTPGASTAVSVKGADRVIFKHDISEFFTTTARPKEEGRAV